MDKVIKYMNKNKNIVIDGKLVFELEQELKRKEQECENYAIQIQVMAQALQEIREIANIIYNTNCNYVAESHKIIAKINEVIGAE